MKNILIAIKLFIALTIITGILYPLSMTVFAQLFFKEKSNGSLIYKGKNCIGSELIGQKFFSPDFFWGRPSAIDNNPFPSGASNMNPVGEKLKEQVQLRVDTIRKYHGKMPIQSIPKDLLFASASGVDPHISPEAVYSQIERVCKYRNFNENQKKKLYNAVQSSIESNDLIIGGQSKINVFRLNIKLMEI